MKSLRERATIVAVGLVASSAGMSGQAGAGIVTVIDDPGLFGSLVGSVTPIDFVAPPGGPGEIDPSVYSAWGVTLSSSLPGWPVFSVAGPGLSDGWGYHGADPADVAFDFDAPIHGFAYDAEHYSGQSIAASFFFGGSLVGSVQMTWPAGPAGYHFVGWATDFAFDRIVVNQYLVDNIYFQTVPGPSCLALLALGACGAGADRRRRRSPS